jgi:hypothetical protein
MDKALREAAEIKRTILTTYKERDKSNFEQFYATVLRSNKEICDILDKKKKHRTDEENERLKNFKKNTTKAYKLVCDYITPEDVEDGKQTKIQKLVDRVALALDYLRYIGANELENEFNRHGISLATGVRLEDKSEVWADDRVKQNIIDIFTAGKTVREQVKNDTKEFAEGIFETAVPPELVYEKNSNPVGLKKSDWSKLVDVQTKLMMAQPGEQLEKAETQLNDLAADKQFDQERARLMQVKLSTMEIQHDEE